MTASVRGLYNFLSRSARLGQILAGSKWKHVLSVFIHRRGENKDTVVVQI